MQLREIAGSRRWGVLAMLVIAVSCRRAPTGDLRVGLASSISQLDPHLENTIASIELLANVYEPLVALDSGMTVRPCLASSWSNPDAVTWVFRLRPSVFFHDGTPLTVEDVVYSLSRPRGDERLKVASYLATVSEVTASGPDTVVIRTRWPNALLLNNLSFVPIVPRGSTTGTLESRPNGTGPWRVDSWKPGKSLKLRWNPGYWGPKPDFERVSMDLAISEADARASLGTSRWDVLRLSSQAVQKLAKQGKAYAVVSYPNIFLRHLAFDVSRDETPSCPGIPNPFRKHEVREAISLALDRMAIARRADPDAIPASQLVPPAVFGFDPKAPPLGRDVERARRLLAEAGLGNGFDVVLHRSGYGAAAEEVKEQLARIGIRVIVSQLRSEDFFAALNRKELSFWIVADGCMTGDALEMLFNSFRSPDPASGAGVDNYGDYRNPDLDQAVAEALGQLDAASRLPALQRGLGIALADVAWVPLYFSREDLIVRRSLTFRPRADGLLRFADVRRAP
ncbi:MAG TPA: ABC transporter substrate-binding protein [Thermoanaerobaculia bacterium]|nr:ABC transporter substrate-binding protein [Thermoanaerobaculia bacterium]